MPPDDLPQGLSDDALLTQHDLDAPDLRPPDQGPQAPILGAGETPNLPRGYSDEGLAAAIVPREKPEPPPKGGLLGRFAAAAEKGAEEATGTLPDLSQAKSLGDKLGAIWDWEKRSVAGGFQGAVNIAAGLVSQAAKELGYNPDKAQQLYRDIAGAPEAFPDLAPFVGSELALNTEAQALRRAASPAKQVLDNMAQGKPANAPPAPLRPDEPHVIATHPANAPAGEGAPAAAAEAPGATPEAVPLTAQPGTPGMWNAPPEEAAAAAAPQRPPYPVLDRESEEFLKNDFPPPKRPPDLMQFLRSKGGVQDQGGELRAMDLHRRALVNDKSGLTLDA